jgi:hypothetical protein
MRFIRAHFSDVTGAGGGTGGGTGASGGSEGTVGQGSGTNDGGAGGGAQPALTLEQALAQIEALKTEKAGAETRVQQFEKDAEERRQASLSEQQKAEERASKAEADAKAAAARVLSTEIKLAAQQAGAVDPDLVRHLIDEAKIQRDANGEPTNLSELVKGVLDAKPYLKAEGAPSRPQVPAVGATNGGTGGGTGAGQSFTTSQIADPKFYAANQAAIHLAVKEGRIVQG